MQKILLAGLDKRHQCASNRRQSTNDEDCYGWWDYSTSGVKRSIFMEDNVFSISRNRMKVNHLDNLETDLVSLRIPSIIDGSDETCVYGDELGDSRPYMNKQSVSA
ncbi:MAG: hypothetical protein A2289_16175 [Deltaproteobacteria bacterium RIFOXYA12_FULL_58_15]|nr:MAG: hypothetical protein A2289_16175 [Deltaproteobacteria bacterium RIFOXYA12_FULL_58_15]OGR15233.1 MAG: hypothetical protein A2341_09065 [Deltaproteobacteria bacterium RIFOXYB12_FULL_58_9]